MQTGYQAKEEIIWFPKIMFVFFCTTINYLVLLSFGDYIYSFIFLFV